MIRVLIADDHALIREGVRLTLSHVGDIEVVAELDSGHSLLETVLETRPDVVLLDIAMPGPSFLDTIATLRRRAPGVPVLVLSYHAEKAYAVRALRAGAMGYVAKAGPTDGLIEAVRRVAEGRRYVSAELGSELLDVFLGHGEREALEILSDREFQVLRLSGAGRSVAEIAKSLSLSPKTVSTYRARIRKKMGFKNQAEAIRYAIEHDLVP